MDTLPIERLRRGDPQVLSRLITLVENNAAEVPSVIRQIYPHTGQATVIGFTGPPGAGKSSLIDRLTTLIREEGTSVGIVVVDPSSPFSGGAVLGDRIRMQRHYLDEGVFIRSMATRGNPGGLPLACHNVVRLLEAAGKDVILVETVGVGQTELDIMDVADTTVVVLVPESGDSIQVMKAGVLEIADILVVNKADRPGACNLVAELRLARECRAGDAWWQVPVLETQAINGAGIADLWQAIKSHRATMLQAGELERKRQARRQREFRRVLGQRIADIVNTAVERDAGLAEALEQVCSGDLDPYSAAEQVLAKPFVLGPDPQS